MQLRFFAFASALTLLAVAPARDARACGGCFIQEKDSTVVTGHRMVLSVSPSQSVLWDQIRYSGDPTEFAWVLPVRAGAVIEASNDAWFETLDAATTTTVLSPQVSCGTKSSLFSCASSAGATNRLDLALGDSGGVTVLHEGTVGPYETVTLKATVPGALNTWLVDHSFNVDAATQPIIDAYVKEQFDFIALRLQPGKGVRQMKPVRVLTAGASPALPLRMVAAGTGPEVAIVLFTISEARLAPTGAPSAGVPPELITWDFATQSSNYAELRRDALAAGGGLAWLTSYANPAGLFAPVDSPTVGFQTGFTSSDGTAQLSTIAQAYADRGHANGEASDTTSCLAAFDGLAASAQEVANPCPLGSKPDDPQCGKPAAGTIDSRTLACGSLDDLAVAMRGLHPKDVWLTRLEADLPRAALSKDLTLQPIAAQVPVDNFLRAGIAKGSPCPSAVLSLGERGSRRGGGGGGPLLGLLFAAGGLAAATARRLGRPRLA